MKKQIQQCLKTALASATCSVLLLSSIQISNATEGSDPNGVTTGSDLITNTCQKDAAGGCTGTCTYQDWTWQHCRAGTGTCTDAKTYTGSPYAGVCYKTASGSIDFIYDWIKYICKIQIGATCGGNCDCKKSGT